MTPSTPTVLSVYNRYVERGGEDEVVESEAALLERHGWRVLRWTAQTREPARVRDKLTLARDTIRAPHRRRNLARLLAAEHVDIVHVHNTFPRISPSIFGVCRAAAIPVIHTLHNYRLLCTAATLFRHGAPCEDCITRTVPWPALLHRCYQGSLARTGVATGAALVHRMLGVWKHGVDLFITPSEFARGRFLAAGWPDHKLALKPNFVHPDPGARPNPGDYALYVGRLSELKGVSTLLEAWADVAVPLRIIGSGPLAAAVETAARGSDHIEYLGRRSRVEVLETLGRARFLVFPSICYEAGPLTILEALASGVPVLCADRGAAAEVVTGSGCGWTFTASDVKDLATKTRQAWGDLRAVEIRGRRARRVYEQRFTGERNYRALMALYGYVLRGVQPELAERLMEAAHAPQ